jgi:hypothetical protein
MYSEDFGVVGSTLHRLMLTVVSGRVRGCGSGYGCGSACTVIISSAPTHVSGVYLGGFAVGSVQTESKPSSMCLHLFIVMFLENSPSGRLVGQCYERRRLGLR